MVLLVSGVLICGEEFGMIYFGKLVFDLSPGQMNTLAFQLIMYTSLLTVGSVREHERFYMSMPGTYMTVCLTLETIVICIISSIG
jgi:hypothetical protein